MPFREEDCSINYRSQCASSWGAGGVCVHYLGYYLLGHRKDQLLCKAQGAQCDGKVSRAAPPCQGQPNCMMGGLVQGPDTHSSRCLPGEQSESQRQCNGKQLFSCTLRQGMISNNRKTHGCSQAVLWKGSPKACKRQGCVSCHRCSCTSQLAKSWAACLSGQLKAANCSK